MRRISPGSGVLVAVYLVAFGGATGCRWLDDRPAPIQPPPYVASALFDSPVFTKGPSSVRASVRDFFGVHPRAEQPIEFPHNTHLSKGLVCTDCHESVERGPVAGLPSVDTCLVCHTAIAVDRPRIQYLAAQRAKGLDVPWQRVFGFPGASHVRFNHAPHIRAKVECATCHGDLSQRTVAERTVDLHMGVCVTCHRERGASNECSTCHF